MGVCVKCGKIITIYEDICPDCGAIQDIATCFQKTLTEDEIKEVYGGIDDKTNISFDYGAKWALKHIERILPIGSNCDCSEEIVHRIEEARKLLKKERKQNDKRKGKV